MSSYYILRFAPLVWTGPVTPNPKPPLFKAGWADTQEKLGRELEFLDADAGSVILQLDADARDVRNDGQLRANARVASRFVILSFTGRHGAMSYPCDTYEATWGRIPSWQHNVRAIALGLEALRAVDRYGIAGRGQQYAGYRQIGTGTAMSERQMTVEDAAEFIVLYADLLLLLSDDVPWTVLVIQDTQARAQAYRQAAKRLHPDVGGDPALFRRLTEARDLLDAQ